MSKYTTWDNIDAASGNGEEWAEEREAATPFEAAEQHVDDNAGANVCVVLVRAEETGIVHRYRVSYAPTIKYESEGRA